VIRLWSRVQHQVSGVSPGTLIDGSAPVLFLPRARQRLSKLEREIDYRFASLLRSMERLSSRPTLCSCDSNLVVTITLKILERTSRRAMGRHFYGIVRSPFFREQFILDFTVCHSRLSKSGSDQYRHTTIRDHEESPSRLLPFVFRDSSAEIPLVPGDFRHFMRSMALSDNIVSIFVLKC
jgi:hypothetical protein